MASHLLSSYYLHKDCPCVMVLKSRDHVFRPQVHVDEKVQGYKKKHRAPPADATLLILRVDDSLLPGRRQFTKSLLPIISTDR